MFVVSYFFVSFFWWVDPTSHGFPFFSQKQITIYFIGWFGVLFLCFFLVGGSYQSWIPFFSQKNPIYFIDFS